MAIGAELEQGPQFPPPAPPVSQEEYENRVGNWQNLFTDPRIQAAILQAGINISQPVPVGQSPLGHLTSGIGSGFEAVGRANEIQRSLAEEGADRALHERTIAGAEERTALAARQQERESAFREGPEFEESKRATKAKEALDKESLEAEKAYRNQSLAMQKLSILNSAERAKKATTAMDALGLTQQQYSPCLEKAMRAASGVGENVAVGEEIPADKLTQMQDLAFDTAFKQCVRYTLASMGRYKPSATTPTAVPAEAPAAPAPVSRGRGAPGNFQQ